MFASPATKASGFARSRTPERAAASSRSASGDLWSGFKARGGSSVLAAESSATSQPGATPTAALALLGLGLIGIVGSTSVFALSRRKAKAGAGSTRNSS